jgi:hypothetical protein
MPPSSSSTQQPTQLPDDRQGGNAKQTHQQNKSQQEAAE